jgi:hypothetical protein
MNTRTWHQIARLVALTVLLALACLPAAPAMAEETGTNWDVQFTGVVDSVPAQAGDPWVIAGQPLTTNSDTRIRHEGVITPTVGLWANVVATRPISSTALLARTITLVPPDARLKGPVQSRPERGNVGNWVIAGQAISVTEQTHIADRTPITGTTWVDVLLRETDGALVALTMRPSEVEPGAPVEVWGAIKTFDAGKWNLSGIPLTVNAQTQITGTAKIGLVARAAATLQAGNTLVANKIKVEWTERPARPPQTTVTITGTVESLPPGRMFFGVWAVSGKLVVVTPMTHVDQNNGHVAIGAEVRVTGRQQPNMIWATDITVVTGSTIVGVPVRFWGKIEALPASGLVGDWTVDGKTVTVTDTTRIEGSRFAVVGANAFVEGLKNSGLITATHIMVMPKMPPHPQLPSAAPAG